MWMPYPTLIAALLTTGPTTALAQVGGDLPGDPAAGFRRRRRERR